MTGNSFPKEVIDYIAENYGERGTSISVDIERMFNVTIRPNTVHKIATRRLGIHYKPTPKPKKEKFMKRPTPIRYTDEEIEFIMENHRKFKRMEDFVNSLNEVGGNNRSIGSVSSKMLDLGISMKKFTDEQFEWLRDNANLHCSKELARMFFDVFGEEHTAQTIRVICYRAGIHCLSDSEARFRHQQNAKTTKGVGGIHVCNGYEYIRVSNRNFGDKQDVGLVPRARYEYEKHYGYAPNDNENIVFLDGDNRNYSKDNLMCVSKRVHMKAHAWERSHFKEHHPIVNKTYIRCYQLEEASKDDQ